MDRVPCQKCGVKVLPLTIERTGGYCMPCFKGPNKTPLMQRIEDKAVRMGLMKDSDRVAHLSDLDVKADLTTTSLPMESTMSNELLPFGDTYHAVLKHKNEAEPCFILSNLSAIIMYKEQEADITSLSLEERYLYVIDGMVREVNNGGFDQFFYNSSGELAYDLLPALEAIGSVQFKAIASKAMALFGEIPSLDEDSRYDHLETITQDGDVQLWEACDDAFYECEEELELMAVKYAEKHLINPE